MNDIKTVYIRNGDQFVPYRIYRCECCNDEIEEAWPKLRTENGIYCGDCAFRLGLIDEKEYLEGFCYFMNAKRAAVHDGKIHILMHRGKFPWEKTDKQNRNSQEYKNWRSSVFKRDGFRCQICGQVGGTLNAHHIKPFVSNEDLRFDIDNGVTLCEACHKKVHKEKDEKWIK